MNRTNGQENGYKQRRESLHIPQKEFAALAGLSAEHLSRVENGRVPVTKEVRRRIERAFDIIAPDALFLLIDYVRIRFKTMDVRYVVERILMIKMQYMAQEARGAYTYTSRFYHGDITVYTSPDESKGVLLELKGKGCRQMEAFLYGQGRDWYSFFRRCLDEDCVFKRIDLALNDRVRLLDIPCLMRKCDAGECITVFRKFRMYRSGLFISGHEEENAAGMGHTLYAGAFDSDLYFCIYEKDYEQLARSGTPLEDTEVKNRFEIRLKNERAYFAVYDLVSYEDAERTAFGIINRYMRIVDRDNRRAREDWPLNSMWAVFIGGRRDRLKLTAKPEPYTLQKTLNWLSHQVAPSWKMLLELDRKGGTNVMEEMIAGTELSEKHRKIIEQQLREIREVVIM
ncbi:replication initiation factor [Agathobaculum sp. NSJ-28]|uniref:Replication initiation factor n=1 Tax=Agathobaculum faecis TaxID=2763013 RepID=A0A923RWM9_9FIRM|nr:MULTISPECIES: replication initiation factor domain-containing protein [Butyricicoccaceae]MBC5725386.1 replication initiation factor [Agathobaculum faecis]MBS6881856.1 replication initiation factor domain-containing protein [Clostridiaceae bacterium]WOC76202.1 replication initiation factor domain-containing protein [Intestinibacillus sp. NTUH-41-i26]